MIRTCKLCKLPQGLDHFPRAGKYHLHKCKPCHEETRAPRVRKPRSEEQKERRRMTRRNRYRQLRKKGVAPQAAARAR